MAVVSIHLLSLLFLVLVKWMLSCVSTNGGAVVAAYAPLLVVHRRCYPSSSYLSGRTTSTTSSSRTSQQQQQQQQHQRSNTNNKHNGDIIPAARTNNSLSSQVFCAMSKNNFSPTSTENTYDTLLERPLLVLLDVLSLLCFASIGKASHSGDDTINFLAVFGIALPFIITWLGITPLLGLYNSDATEQQQGDSNTTIGQTLKRLTKGWVVAIPLGIVLRGMFKGFIIPPTSFIVVTFISTWVILACVRAIYSTVEQKF